MQKKGTLYLIPVTLADVPHHTCLPQGNDQVVRQLKYFIVEELRTARRFIKAVDKNIDIDTITFYTLNEHTPTEEVQSMLNPLFEGHDIGVLSEAGCPAIADPGAQAVRIAQRNNITVTPLIGPSSILLSLMASGFNGQQFAFRGYIPIDDKQRTLTIKEMDSAAQRDQTQIFIETPYRNNKLLSQLTKHCHPDTLLCVARNITSPEQEIITRPIHWWKKQNKELPKQPTIFLLGK